MRCSWSPVVHPPTVVFSAWAAAQRATNVQVQVLKAPCIPLLNYLVTSLRVSVPEIPVEIIEAEVLRICTWSGLWQKRIEESPS